MKKLAIGCGILILVLSVAGAVAAYFIYSRIGGAVAQFAELAQVPEIEKGIANQAGFTPPASGSLTRDQVERLVRVQGRIREHLGTRVAEFEQRYKTLIEKDQATAVDLPQVIAAYRDMASAWVEAKRIQVEALNDTRFSLEEYRWVRARAYAALGVPLADIDVARLIDAARRGDSPTIGSGIQDVAPPQSGADRELVEPFRKDLERNVALASLGL